MNAKSRLSPKDRSLDHGQRAIAHFFKEKRLQSGVSVSFVCEALSLSEPSLLAAYESGAQAIPLEDIFTLTNLLNVNPDEVVALMLEVSAGP